MSDDHRERPSGRDEPVGTLSEEAARLFGVLAGMARDHGAEAAGNAADSAAHAAHNFNEHIATDQAECRYCPICQVVHVVRATSPEVKAHLLTAANSLVQAAATALATQVPEREPSEPVQRIDLDEDGGWEES